ncbi:hypothetical protein [Cupriavidus sp. D384]|uniref:hypothetical protein n=1 Tax=Cupriavidus sp. D384 TaxID=1538095 RepID=UPI0012E8F622|nr:hypothetical protein [Cupriavidus sp. D384]
MLTPYNFMPGVSRWWMQRGGESHVPTPAALGSTPRRLSGMHAFKDRQRHPHEGHGDPDGTVEPIRRVAGVERGHDRLASNPPIAQVRRKKCLNRTGWMAAKVSVQSEAKDNRFPRTDLRRGSGRSAIGETRNGVGATLHGNFSSLIFRELARCGRLSSVLVNFAM